MEKPTERRRIDDDEHEHAREGVVPASRGGRGLRRRAERIGDEHALLEGGSGRDPACRYVYHCHILVHEDVL